MIRRTTWIYLAVFVILLGLAFYLNQSGALDEDGQASPTPRPQLVEIGVEMFRQVELESAQGERILLDKDAQGSWQLIEPSDKVIGSMTSLDTAVNAIPALQALSTLETKIAIEVIGLSPPAYTLTLRSNDGREHILRIGSKTPTGSGYYVQTPEGGLYVASTFSVESVLKLLSDPAILVTPTPEITPTPVAATPGADTGTATPEP